MERIYPKKKKLRPVSLREAAELAGGARSG